MNWTLTSRPALPNIRRRAVGPASFAFLIAALLASNRLMAQSGSGSNPHITGELVLSGNHHYFSDGNGHAVLLGGSQTWNTLQDWGTGGTAVPLDFAQFRNFLLSHGHNFTLLWTVETPGFCNLPVVAGQALHFTVSPFPWKRTGPGNATDGKPKFDLKQFDSLYFSRLRERVEALNKAGIYAGVYLFTGEFLNLYRCADDGYPFTGANNVNGVDDGYTGGNRGINSVSMTAPNAITS